MGPNAMRSMYRREFLGVLGGATAVWPRVARSQQQALPLVGFVHILSPEIVPQFVPAFRQGLKDVGYVEGQNLAVEYHWAQGRYDRLPDLVAANRREFCCGAQRAS
jgi:putative ABC transport system substrate-binding protein